METAYLACPLESGGRACPKEVRMPRWIVIGSVMVVSAFLGGGLGGCGSNHEEMICDEAGCRICDAYGCRPASPSVTGSGGTAGGAVDSGSPEPDVQSPPFCDPSTALCPCGGQSDCDEGYTCLDGVCLVPCEFSSECGASRICVNGRCVVGCDTLVPCPDGYSCNAIGVCEIDSSTAGCGGASPCPGGLVCVEGVCRGTCETTAECASGEVCHAPTGTCIADPQPVRPCAKDPSVCGENQACVEGYCRYPCTDDMSCKLIDARIPVCKDKICMSQAEAAPECTKKQDCPGGKDCVSNVCK